MNKTEWLFQPLKKLFNTCRCMFILRHKIKRVSLQVHEALKCCLVILHLEKFFVCVCVCVC